LEHALAWHIQAKAFGGVDRRTLRLLKEAGAGAFPDDRDDRRKRNDWTSLAKQACMVVQVRRLVPESSRIEQTALTSPSGPGAGLVVVAAPE
jgi:hypothetical protein